jgi:ubiquinone/menaquinone biosynthesis C-methylase UbiE
MNLKRLRRNWDALGKTDPLWAILSVPEKKGNRWDLEEFLATGQEEIDNTMADLATLGLEPKSGRALDFGCGAGRLTQALADRFDEVWGVDIAPSMIELAHRYNRHPARCRYFLNDRPDLRLFEDGSFDFIYSNITLQHIEPTYHGSYLTEFLRVLVRGGLLVFQLPSRKRVTPEPNPSGKPAGSKRPLKERVRPMTPDPLIDLYRWTRARVVLRRMQDARKEVPRMEMWGTPREEVEELLRQHGGRLLDAATDEWAPEWVGFRYTVTKD